jgi:hypothetical protein
MNDDSNVHVHDHHVHVHVHVHVRHVHDDVKDEKYIHVNENDEMNVHFVNYVQWTNVSENVHVHVNIDVGHVHVRVHVHAVDVLVDDCHDVDGGVTFQLQSCSDTIIVSQFNIGMYEFNLIIQFENKRYI